MITKTINQPQQLIITLDENAAVANITRLLKAIRGISSVSRVKKSMKLQQQEYVKATLIPALRETKKAMAEGKKMKSVDDFLKELEQQ